MAKAFENIPEEFVSKTAIFDYKTPVSKLLGKINSLGAVVITKEKEYYGVLDARTIAQTGVLAMADKFPAGKFARKVPVLDQSLSIERAIHHFFNSSTKVLPYIEGNKIKGVVKRELMLRAILSLHLLSNYKTEYLMSSPIVAIEKGASLAQAKSTMENHKVNKILVMEGGKLYGIISYRDMMGAFAKTNLRANVEKEGSRVGNLNNTKVEELAVTNVYRIDYSRPIDEAIKSMIELGISSLLVTKSDKPVGILTVSDVFEVIVSNATGIEERIFISGLDSKTKEFEEEIKAELESLAAKVDRFGKIKTDYISLNIKSSKAKNYELKARLSLSKGGSLSTSSFGFTLDEAMKKLVDNLYREVRQKKEIIMSGKKSGEREEA
ncbi:MAG: CBS domain-containing protein [Candidatus Micrarchaeota archaeon]|nr:CBS domain-containing protein [Candidatus Micrarchaeota archaeon]